MGEASILITMDPIQEAFKACCDHKSIVFTSHDQINRFTRLCIDTSLLEGIHISLPRHHSIFTIYYSLLDDNLHYMALHYASNNAV